MKCVHERIRVDEEKQNMNDGAKGKWQIGRRASGRLAEGQVANRPKAETCSLTEETNMKHGYERNIVEQMPRAEVANRPKGSGKSAEGRKAALQPHPVNLREFFR